MTGNWLRRFSHMQIRLLEVLVWRVDCMVFSCTRRRRERPRRTFEEIIKRDLIVSNILENLVFNQVQ